MNRREYGFISFGTMTLLIGGMALAGLLLYGWTSGQELPVWPAVAVVLVNLVASIKLVIDAKKAKNQAENSGKKSP